MSYRFVKITSYYRNFLNYYYGKNPDKIFLSYNEQLEHLLSQGFGWADFYRTQLNFLGNEAHEIIFNIEPLQRKWAEERNLKLSGDDILTAQLKELKPDVVFFQDSLSFPADFFDRLRSEVPSIKKVIGWCCSPFSDTQILNFDKMDFVCTCSPHFQNIFKARGLKSYELNHAFEPSLLEKINTKNKFPDTEIIFIGSFFITKDFHDFRLRLVEELLKTGVDISLYANVVRESAFNLFSRQSGYLISKGLYNLGFRKLVYNIEPLKKSFLLKEMPRKQSFSADFLAKVDNTPLFSIEMLKAISKAKIGFNSHGGIAGDYAANMRMFEVTGAGSCLLTDNKLNMHKFFEPGKEAVVYDSPEDCKEKVLWLINNPDKMAEIAKAGQQRTLAEHNFKNRAEQLNIIILNELKN